MTNQPNTPTGTWCDGGVPAGLARIRTEVAALAHTLWAARDAGELMETFAQIEALKSTLDGVGLGVVRELDTTGGVKPLGWASTQDFITATTGGHHGTAHALLRLATQVDTPLLAPLGEAMVDVWLCTTKAHVIEHAIETLPSDPATRQRGVQAMLTEANGLDATELRKIGRRLVTIVDPDSEERRAEKELDREERAAHLNRDLSIRFDGAGGAWIKGRCSSEDAANLKATLIPLARPAPKPVASTGPSSGPLCDPASCQLPGCSHDGRDPRDHGTRMWDALIELCSRAQSADLLPESHSATPRVTLTMNLEDLRGESGYATTETGEELSPATIRRMCCDADLIPMVLGSAGEVLDVGRTQRLVTAAIWKALVTRDKHCRFPHCTRPPIMTHAHHLTHWANGGATSLQNLILLCGHHHRLIHAGPWHIRRTGPNHYDFTPPPGIRRWAKAHEPWPDA